MLGDTKLCAWPVQAATTQSQDPAEVAARQERADAEQKAYDTLKQELWRWSVGITALFFAGSIVLFSRVRSFNVPLFPMGPGRASVS